MSIYHLINNGVSSCVWFILPMLNHHPDYYPRFRDCFIDDEEHPKYKDHIHVYTRVGGSNRNCGFKEEKLYKNKYFVTTFDDNSDSTYASYIFRVPDKWRSDFEKFKNDDIKNFSMEYQKQIKKIYPKLANKFNELWENKQGDHHDNK